MPFKPEYDVPPDRRAFELPGTNDVGCLLLHGFMGTPKTCRPLAEHLQAFGVSCLGPLLPGHGRFPDQLHKVPNQAWLDEAESWYWRLREQCQDLFIVGHSMGGIIGAYLARKFGNVRGLVLLAPPYVVPDPRMKLMWFIRYVKPWFTPWHSRSLNSIARERVHDFDPNIDVDDPALQAWLAETTRFPTSALDEMCKMAALGRTLWPQLTLPVLVLQGGKDRATSPQTAQQVYDHIKNGGKQIVTYADGGHELLRPSSPFHQEVWARVREFIQAHTDTPLSAA